MAGPKQKEKQSKARVFISRASTTLVLWALIALAVCFEKPVIFSSIIVILGVLGLHEFLGMLNLKKTPAFPIIRLLTLLLSSLYLILLNLHLSGAFKIEISAIDTGFISVYVILATTVLLFYSIDDVRTKDLFFGSVFGLIYITVLISFLIRILYIDVGLENKIGGAYYIIFLLIVTKFSDMGAYLVGTLIGKNKMIPHISPGKTWEGFLFGCLTFAIGGGAIFYGIFQEKMMRLAWSDVLLLGLILALVAAVGDLAESIIKRSLKTKDSGSILPGIGGILDLIDSVLFTAPVLYLYLSFFS